MTGGVGNGSGGVGWGCCAGICVGAGAGSADKGGSTGSIGGRSLIGVPASLTDSSISSCCMGGIAHAASVSASAIEASRARALIDRPSRSPA
jgi:hypothetical protein